MVAELSAELIGQVEQGAQLLQSAKRVCILTGAGISAESGIPTFRDKQTGLWEKFRAEDLASPVAFARDPKLVWSWYQWRRQLVHDKAPNPAHQALAQWQAASSSLGQYITLITQNVDDLHEQAAATLFICMVIRGKLAVASAIAFMRIMPKTSRLILMSSSSLARTAAVIFALISSGLVRRYRLPLLANG